ncbi:hypothetical protein [Dactylosporangium darangshiense]|uniref:hypothetical protein n=1 Tax=Dactylosporangium darangshiense TaxID=579108 RepID=UPI00364555DB
MSARRPAPSGRTTHTSAAQSEPQPAWRAETKVSHSPSWLQRGSPWSCPPVVMRVTSPSRVATNRCAGRSRRNPTPSIRLNSSVMRRGGSPSGPTGSPSSVLAVP